MSASFAGREELPALLRTNRSFGAATLTPGSMGSHLAAGASVDSSGNFRGPVRRSYTDASVLRQVEAAIARSESLSGNWTSFSASANVATETSGPNSGPAPNAGGAPGGNVDKFCARMREAAAPPSTASDVRVKNSLRDFINSYVGADAFVRPEKRSFECRHHGRGCGLQLHDCSVTYLQA